MGQIPIRDSSYIATLGGRISTRQVPDRQFIIYSGDFGEDWLSAGRDNNGYSVTNQAVGMFGSAFSTSIGTGAYVAKAAVGIYLSLKDHPTAQAAFAYEMMNKEVTRDSGGNILSVSTTYSMWTALYLAAITGKLQQNELNKRIRGYTALGGDYEAKKRYAEAMIAKVRNSSGDSVFVGIPRDTTDPNVCAIGMLYFSESGALSSYIGKIVIVLYDASAHSGTMADPHVAKIVYPGSPELLGGSTIVDPSKEIEMWNAAGAQLNYSAPVAADRRRTTDVSRRFALEMLYKKIMNYVGLKEDYLGKMRLAERYKSEAQTPEEQNIWDNLVADCALLLKLRAVRTAIEAERNEEVRRA